MQNPHSLLGLVQGLISKFSRTFCFRSEGSVDGLVERSVSKSAGMSEDPSLTLKVDRVST